MNRLAQSFKHALHGLSIAWQDEQNFRVEVVIALGAILFMLLFGFSFIEWALGILAITLVLMAELGNTAIENLCDKIEQHEHWHIKKIKDIAAGYVLVSCISGVLIGIFTLLHHIFA